MIMLVSLSSFDSFRKQNFEFVFIFNWIFVILSFILLNYNLYSLLCSYSFLNYLNIHNFYYFFVNSDIFIYSEYNYSYIISPLINIYKSNFSNFLVSLSDFKTKNDIFINSINAYINNVQKFDNTNIYCVYFDTKVINNTSLIFYPLQRKLFILPGETSLCFYRIINNSNLNIHGIPIYIISPFEFSSFITKVQCFCFEEIFIFPFEIIELPILFYINSRALSLSYSFKNEFSIEYIFFCNLFCES